MGWRDVIKPTSTEMLWQLSGSRLYGSGRRNKRLNAGEPHNVEQNNLATLLPDLL